MWKVTRTLKYTSYSERVDTMSEALAIAAGYAEDPGMIGAELTVTGPAGVLFQVEIPD